MWHVSFIPVLCNSEEAAVVAIAGAAEISAWVSEAWYMIYY